ncbi:MAG: hypothetical protein ACI8YI_002873 [Paracoccaceae bacterium]|jgi:hypothetical protein
MRMLITSLMLTIFALTGPAHAGDRPVVVELYTSQGCSSCPPADEILAKLAGQENVIALALHVDYWDYLGWKDDFGSKEYSDRQRAYAKAGGKRTIYTPQMVIQGESHAIGNRVNDVASLVAEHGNQENVVDLKLTRAGDQLTIQAKAKNGGVGRTSIQLVRYIPEQSVNIRAGELAGRKLNYVNIVTEWHALTQWNGRGDKTFEFEVTGNQPIVVLVQAVGSGPIIAAEVLQ